MAVETKKNKQLEVTKKGASRPHTIGLKGRRELKGVIIKKSGDKTVAVEVTRVYSHELYNRKVLRSKKYLAHDEANAGEVGQKVSIREMKPGSARKRFVLVVGDNKDK